MTLPITAQGFDHPHQLGLKHRMARGDGGESLGVGQPGQLVQIAGKALELGEPFEMLTPQPLADLVPTYRNDPHRSLPTDEKHPERDDSFRVFPMEKGG